MAATHGQSKDVRDVDGNATASLTLDTNPTAGSTVAGVVWWSNATSNLNILTVQGNAATLVGSVLEANGRRSQAFYYPNVANTSCVVAVTLDAVATEIRIVVHEVLGAHTTNPLTDYSPNAQAGVAIGADAITAGAGGTTTATDGSYFMGVAFSQSGTASSPGTGFTQAIDQATRESEYLEQASAASQDITFDADGAGDNWHTWGLVFIPASVPATIVNFWGCESGSGLAYEGTTSGGTFSLQSTVKRSGGYALRVNPTTTAVGWFRVGGHDADGLANNNLNLATCYDRFYFRWDTAPAANEEIIWQARTSGGAIKCSLRLTSTGTIKLLDSAGATVGTSAALTTATWYRIEVKAATGASAAVELQIDGSTSVSSATANLHTSNHGHHVYGKPTDTNGQTIDVYYDDSVISATDWPGPGYVTVVVPNANGSTMQWTAGTGPSDYTEVNELPNITANYVKNTGGANEVALFALQNLTLAAGESISAVKVVIFPRLDATGTCATSIRSVSGVTTVTGSTRALTTGGSILNQVFATDPNTNAAWTETAFNAMEVGAIETTTEFVRLLEIYVMVAITVETLAALSGSASTGGHGTASPGIAVEL